jgi:hypothetical protein
VDKQKERGEKGKGEKDKWIKEHVKPETYNRKRKHEVQNKKLCPLP